MSRMTRPRPLATTPRVTVVVPCYRYGRFLPEVVRTTLEQPGVEVDIRIVDDASPDDSGEIAQSLADTYPQVTVLRHETNRGHIATYNDGLAAASGTYVVLLSADDLLAPGSLARATALMESHPSVSFVYGYSPEFFDTPQPPRPRRESWTIWSSRDWLRHTCRLARNLVGTPEVVMRRSVMDDIGPYEATLPHTADLLTWLRAAARGDVGRINGPDQAYYRVHGENMHLTDFGSALTDLAERKRTFDVFIDTDLDGHPEQSGLRRRVDHALAVEAVRWAVRAHDLNEVGADENMEVLAATAVELWPSITSSTLWWRYQRRRTQQPALRLDRLAFLADWEVRHKLRWRRWRRFGT